MRRKQMTNVSISDADLATSFRAGNAGGTLPRKVSMRVQGCTADRRRRDMTSHKGI